jgi:Family of unknown function (DUF5696)
MKEINKTKPSIVVNMLNGIKDYFVKKYKDLKDYGKEKIENYKFPWALVIFLGAILLFVLIMFILIQVNKVPAQKRPVFDKTGFVHAMDLDHDENKLALKNDRFKLYFDETTSFIKVVDTVTNETWQSNVTEKDNFPNIMPQIEYAQKTVMTVYYHDDFGAEKTISNYVEVDPTSVIEENHYQKFSVRYNEDGTFEVLYEFGQKAFNYMYLPKIISVERMESVILPFLDARGKKAVENYYNLDRVREIYTYNGVYENMNDNVFSLLYAAFYEKAGYTLEDAYADNEENGVVFSDKSPYFEVAIRYSLTDNGLHVEVINDSIQEKPHLPVTKIELFKYFGTASNADEGYVVLPDGSGSLMNLNNGKQNQVSYSKRIYGKDNSVTTSSMPNPEETYNMPMFGLKRNQSGFIAIIENGAPMTTIKAEPSMAKDSYNKVYPTFHYRETDNLELIAGNSKKQIQLWTKYIDETDFEIEYQFLKENESDYVGMAKKFQAYLLDNGFAKRDVTDTPVMNLTLLGGYTTKEFFLGVPYDTVRSLTSFDQAKKIMTELKGNNINNLNVIYSGWMNDGIKHSLPNDIDFNKVVGKKKDFKSLIKFADKNDVTLYPEIALNNVYSSKGFKENKDAARYVSGDIASHQPFDPATRLPDATRSTYWTLNPSAYNKVVNAFLKDYGKFDLNSLSLQDFASELNGSYKRQNNTYRSESIELQMAAFNKLQAKIENLVVRNPLIYTVQYSSNVVDLPVETTHYFVIDESIPFYQLTLNGLVDYAGPAFNIEDQYSANWHKLRAIETGSNLNYTWSYQDSSKLINTEFNEYYSTNYRNWFDDSVSIYGELAQLGLYKGTMVDHEILGNGLRRVEYSTGLEIVINYTEYDVTLGERVVKSQDYLVVKEGN